MARGMRRIPIAILLALTLTSTAHAFRLDGHIAAIPGNPSDRVPAPLDDEEYDPATHCSRKRRPGVEAAVRWLQRRPRGAFWGSYRCEKWGDHEASLHAEGRAVDWHLDVGNGGDRDEARHLIRLLLAPDKLGQPHALARRMGVEEIIWDCSYWGAGMEDFSPYRACFNKHGDLRKHVDPSIAHRNHVHLGFTKAGAAGTTSFWRARARGAV